jgi:nitroimidazol reductase NimA-like FMN-containing flavoprotein (pyridoxamine 5'-phosphate oxidase superfamily)
MGLTARLALVAEVRPEYALFMSDFTPTDRTQVKRLPKRGKYDQVTVHRILDEAFVCHVGFAADGQPFVIPTNFGRIGDTLYLHGSAASRMLRTLSEGIPVCVTVTLVDGLVLARSAFHHSVNYRSVVILGTAKLVEDPTEKMEALRLFTEHIMKGRWDEIRWPTEQELKATTVLALPLEEVSAKVRVGGPVDDEEDYTMPVWAGVLPIQPVPQAPVPDTRLKAGTPVPNYITNYSR